MNRWGWAAAFVGALVVVLGLARLRFDTNILALVPPDLPAVRALGLQQRFFSASGELFITLRAEDPSEAERNARSLATALRDIPGLARRVVWTSPWEERPDLAAELSATLWLNQPLDVVEALTNRFSGPGLAAQLEAARSRLATSLSPREIAEAGYDPLGLLSVPGQAVETSASAPSFVSPDGSFRVITLSPARKLPGYAQTVRWLEEVRSAVRAWSQSETNGTPLRIRFTGGPAFADEISRGMERDMLNSVAGTAVIITALFYWAHRRFRPLLLLLCLLALTLVATLGAGGIFFRELNVVSLGFSAILLGLAVDYGLVLHEELQENPGLSPWETRRAAGPGICWAALSTAAAFACLPLGGLPGLTQLGMLVAVGALLAAAIMVGFYVLPALGGAKRSTGRTVPAMPDGWALMLTVVGIITAGVVLRVSGTPRLDQTAEPLRPSHSEAYAAMSEMNAELGGSGPDPWIMVAPGETEAEVATLLHKADAILSDPQSREAMSFHVPTALWPDPARQEENKRILAPLAANRGSLEADFNRYGFNESAFQTTAAMLDTWTRAASERGSFWPTNEVSSWVLDAVTVRNPNTGPRCIAIGMLRPKDKAGALAVAERLRDSGLLVGGWDLLGSELIAKISHRVPLLIGVVAVLWLSALILAFRAWVEVLSTIFAMGVAILLLLAVMVLSGWTWNLMNLVAVPLLMGTGTDYAIHMQLALRRHHGDRPAVQKSTGRAVFLCAATTIAGFGSLAWSSNAGLASLGKICAAGLACSYVVSAQLLPAWWRLSHRHAGTNRHEVAAPSSFYRHRAWRLALRVAHLLPHRFLRNAVGCGVLVYAAFARHRRRIVAENLAPLLNTPDTRKLNRVVWRNFSSFGQKLGDLWVYEAGKPINHLFRELTGWQHFDEAQKTGRGILLVTPHLGNWEFGAPILLSRGVRLLVITLAEPDPQLTQVRQAARAQRGIATLVVGQDPFDFIEIIKRLQEGGVVALLVDRPPAPGAVEIDLFGRPFPASIAPAELARASGCILLPTVIPLTGSGYAAHILPPVPYDRRLLADREARRKLTQDILRAFEPFLRQYPEQWYHFVRVWPPSVCSPSRVS